VQGLFEGMKAYRRPGRAGYTLFRPEENARRMQFGAERMCMPAPSVDQFVSAVKETVLANRRAFHYFITRMRIELSARTPLIDLCDDLFRSRCRRRERGPCTSGPCSWGAARFWGWRRPPSTRSSSTPRPSETTSRSVHALIGHDRWDPETYET